MLPIRYIFMSPIPKHRRIWPSARAVHARHSFHVQKILGTLKMSFKEKIWNKKFVWICLPAQNKMGKFVFNLVKGKIIMHGCLPAYTHHARIPFPLDKDGITKNKCCIQLLCSLLLTKKTNFPLGGKWGNFVDCSEFVQSTLLFLFLI